MWRQKTYDASVGEEHVVHCQQLTFALVFFVLQLQLLHRHNLPTVVSHQSKNTHTHTRLTALFPSEPVPERQNQSGFYWSKRQRCPSCRPTNRVKAPKARQTKKSYKIKWNYAQCNSADNFISKAKAHPRMLSMADTSKLRLKLIKTSLHIHVCTSIIDTGCYNLNAKFNVYLYKNQKRQIHRFVVGRPPDLASLDTCPQRCCSLGRCGQHHWQTGKLESSHQQRHVAELCTVQTSSNAYTLLLLPWKTTQSSWWKYYNNKTTLPQLETRPRGVGKWHLNTGEQHQYLKKSLVVKTY